MSRQTRNSRARSESPPRATPAPTVTAMQTPEQKLTSDDIQHVIDAVKLDLSRHYDEKLITLQRQVELVFQHEKDQLEQEKRELQAQVRDVTSQLTKYTQQPPRTPNTFKTPTVPRQQDTEYRELLDQKSRNNPSPNTNTSTNTIDDLVKALTSGITRATTKDAPSEPPKFNGTDAGWEKWWKLFRAYCKGKRWLSTLEHPTGPGNANNPTRDFDVDISEKIYTKLQHLTQDGTAAIQLAKAAEFDGWGAAQALISRYSGFTQQKLRTLKDTIKKLRHTNGTSMPKHIDEFERLIMAMDACGHSPPDEEQMEWLMCSVTESTYDHVKAYAEGQRLDQTMTFQKLVSMYNNTCFAKYPQFQMEEALGKRPNQNSQKFNKNETGKWCAYHKTSSHDTAECRDLQKLALQKDTSSTGVKVKAVIKEKVITGIRTTRRNAFTATKTAIFPRIVHYENVMKLKGATRTTTIRIQHQRKILE